MTEVLATDERVAGCILTLRGIRVILDANLAGLYGVPTKRLNEQVRRNSGRFPGDFLFQLTCEETMALRSQFATSKLRRGGRRHRPYAFTEHGAIMAASVLNSPRAVEASVVVVRGFVRLRQMLSTHRELAGKLAELEQRVDTQDGAIGEIMEAIRELMDPARERIGFR